MQNIPGKLAADCYLLRDIGKLQYSLSEKSFPIALKLGRRLDSSSDEAHIENDFKVLGIIKSLLLQKLSYIE